MTLKICKIKLNLKIPQGPSGRKLEALFKNNFEGLKEDILVVDSTWYPLIILNMQYLIMIVIKICGFKGIE